MELPRNALDWLLGAHRRLGAVDDWSRGGRPNRYWHETSLPRQLLGVGTTVAALAPCTPVWDEAHIALLDAVLDRYTSWRCVDQWMERTLADPDHRVGDADPLSDPAMADYAAGLALLLGLRAALSGDSEHQVELVRDRQYHYPWRHGDVVEQLSRLRVSTPEPDLTGLALWASGASSGLDDAEAADSLRRLARGAPDSLGGPALECADAAVAAAGTDWSALVAPRSSGPRLRNVDLDVFALRRAEWVSGCLHVGVAPVEPDPAKRVTFLLVGDEPRMWYLTGIEGASLDTAGAAVVVRVPRVDGELVFAPSSY